MTMSMQTERLCLASSDPVLSADAAKYFLRNRDFLSATEPEREAAFFTEAFQRELMRKDLEESKQGLSAKFWFSLKTNPSQIIGTVGLNNIVRGPFQSCFLSYRGDREHVCRGFVTEAVGFAVGYAFYELQLHRIEANIMPRNTPSLRVAEKLGFQNEGISEGYLRINGNWEDHIHMVRLNTEMK